MPAGKENKQTKKSDEYAFHYCCNVVTTLMRSMESWTSHFVVSPIHSLVQKIHCGIVLRHIHSDGWMLMLMFQTTEHHSQNHIYLFFMVYLETHRSPVMAALLLFPNDSCNENACFREKESVFIIISAFSCNYLHPMRLFITNLSK